MSLDAERLAAFMDGRLSPKEREAVLAELDASPELLELYADAAAVRAETEGDTSSRVDREPSVRVVRRRRPWFGFRAFVAVAAVAVVAFLAPAIWRDGDGTGFQTPQDFVSGSRPFDAQFLSQWDATPWPQVRGGAPDGASLAAGVRMGARVVRYLTLVSAKDTSAATVAFEIAEMLDAKGFGGAAAAEFRSLSGSAQRDVESPTIARAIDAAEQVVGQDELRGGAWLETLRLAVARSDSNIVARADDGRALARLARLAKAAPNASPAIGQLTSAIEAGATPFPTIGLLATAALKELARS